MATGICRYVRQVYGALARGHGHEARFLFFDGCTASPAMPDPAAADDWGKKAALARALPAPMALAARLALHARRERAFSRVLREHPVDVYHETAFFPFRVPPGFPTLFTVHDLSLQRHPEWHPRERVWYSQLFFRRRLRLATHVLTISEFTARELQTWADLPAGRITVTPLAHDPALFHVPNPELVARVRARYQLPPRFFLFLGSGDPRKNAAIIPQALARLRDRTGQDMPLVSVGWSGWLAGTQQAGTVQIQSLGFVPDEDLAGLYAAATALIFPSRYEGFGLPVLEAMACGCPVVTTTAASLPEAGGEAALYMTHPDDADGLAGLLGRLADPGPAGDALRARCSTLGLAHAAGFSWERVAETTWQALRQCLQQPLQQNPAGTSPSRQA
ncbi:hypothetical protein JCM14635_08800 [Megalodesulfovibrio paquesii]